MAEKHILKYPNGATLIYYKQNVNSTTDVTMGFLCGSDKDGEKKGLAHALEHSIFHGTEEMDEKEMYEIFRQTSTNQNAFTTQDFICTTFNCPNKNVEKVFKINADMLAKQNFKEEDWKKERKVILQELYLSHKDDDSMLIHLTAGNKTVKSSDDLLGNLDTLSAITTQDFVDYKNKYFITDNLVVSVVSSMPYEDVKNMVEQHFINRFPKNEENKVKITKRRYKFKDAEVIKDMPGSETFDITFLLKGHQKVEKNDLFTTFEDWYFNAFAGKLYQKFRIENQLVYSAYFANVEPVGLKLKSFNISTSPENVNKCIDVMTGIFKDIIEKGVTEEEFNAFRETMLAERERKTNLKMHQSSNLFIEYVYGDKIFVKNFFDKLMNLSREEINEYFRKVYTRSMLNVVLKGDMVVAQKLFDISKHPFCAMSSETLTQKLGDTGEPIYDIGEILVKYNPLIKVLADLEISAKFNFVDTAKEEKLKHPKFKKQIRSVLAANKKRKIAEEKQKRAEERKAKKEELELKK